MAFMVFLCTSLVPSPVYVPREIIRDAGWDRHDLGGRSMKMIHEKETKSADRNDLRLLPFGLRHSECGIRLRNALGCLLHCHSPRSFITWPKKFRRLLPITRDLIPRFIISRVPYSFWDCCWLWSISSRTSLKAACAISSTVTW